MLKTIAIVTFVVRSLAAVEPAYVEQLHYAEIERGEISRSLAQTWDTPAMKGRKFSLLVPESGEAVYLRFIEAPKDSEAVRPFMTYGWNAAEFLVTDPDALARRLEHSPFRVIGQPRNLGPDANAPRAMQALGPADEVLYLTRIIPGGTGYDLGSARTAVDRVYITVVGGPDMAALRDFYGNALGMPLSDTNAWKITVLSAAYGLPAETTFPLALAALPQRFLIELDDYPDSAVPRPIAKGALPGGMAMVSFTSEKLDDLKVQWRARPRVLQAFPYSGRRAGVTVGPGGEWLEIIEE